MPMNYEQERALQSEMNEGETLLWSGQPNPVQYARKSIPTALFGIPFTAFAVFWMWGASGGMSPHHSSLPSGFDFFPLFGIPFLLAGLSALTSPIWSHRQASDTVYAVTSKRALIISGRNARKVQSFYRNNLGHLDRIEKADGTGDLIFERQLYPQLSQRGPFNNSSDIGFIGILNPREVEILIQQHLNP